MYIDLVWFNKSGCAKKYIVYLWRHRGRLLMLIHLLLRWDKRRRNPPLLNNGDILSRHGTVPHILVVLWHGRGLVRRNHGDDGLLNRACLIRCLWVRWWPHHVTQHLWLKTHFNCIDSYSYFVVRCTQSIMYVIIFYFCLPPVNGT